MSLPATMSAVQLTRHGGPEALVWRDDLALPQPGPGDVLLRVLAAGVNATDINTRIGWYGSGEAAGWTGALAFPRIQGSDLCGRVVAQGDGVTSPELGVRVICPTNQAEPRTDNPLHFVALGSEYDGAFAQFCVVPARHLYDVSAAPLSDIELGAMPCAFGTAHGLVSRAGVAAGAEVLVTGASGGVGLAAVQLARRLGAAVTGQCSAAKAAAVRDAGADVLDRDCPPEARRFDIVIDLVGGPGFQDRLAALRPGGRYATSGAAGGPLVEADLRSIYLADLTLIGCTYQSPGQFAELVALINAGAVRPLVSATYPLAEIARAQADLAAGRFPGKLALIPPETVA
jgi:alcohol dehydrogenase